MTVWFLKRVRAGTQDGRPGSDAAAGSRRCVLKISNGQRFNVDAHEVWLVARHPKFLLFVVATCLFVVPLSPLYEISGVSGWQAALLVVICTLTAFSTSMLVLLLLFWIGLRTVYSAIVSVVAGGLATLLSNKRGLLHIGSDQEDWSNFYAIVGFNSVLVELLFTLFCALLLDRILAEIRGTEGAGDAFEPPQTGTHRESDAVAGPRDAVGQGRDQTIKVRIAEIEFRVAEIEAIQADGNYVKVYSGAETHMLRARLSEVLERIPEDLGFHCHRSWWVAAPQVQDTVVSDQGELLVVMQSGLKVPVSKRRKAKFQAWLEFIMRLNKAAGRVELPRI